MIVDSVTTFFPENKYWCYLKKMYVEPEQPNCDEFKHPIRGPLDKYTLKLLQLMTSRYSFFFTLDRIMYSPISMKTTPPTISGT